jgi:hypothetical protein
VLFHQWSYEPFAIVVYQSAFDENEDGIRRTFVLAIEVEDSFELSATVVVDEDGEL